LVNDTYGISCTVLHIHQRTFVFPEGFRKEYGELAPEPHTGQQRCRDSDGVNSIRRRCRTCGLAHERFGGLGTAVAGSYFSLLAALRVRNRRDGYLLDSGSPNILWSGQCRACIAFDHRFVRDRVDGDSLLEESEKEFAPATRFPPVEAEGEFVQVIVQVLQAHRSLMRAHQPALEEGNYGVDARHQFRWSLLLSHQERDLVIEAFAFQGQVAQPTVGVHDAARLNGVLHKRYQTLRRSVRDSPHPNSTNARSILLSRNHNQCLGFRLASTDALLQAAQVRLVHLDSPGQPIPVRAHHCTAQFMQPRPGRFVTLQPQHPLEENSLFVAPADGSGTARKLTSFEHFGWATSVARNGTVAIMNSSSTGGITLGIVNLHEPSSIRFEAEEKMQPAISPDGHWLAFVSKQAGSSNSFLVGEITVEAFPRGGARLVISTEPGSRPRWRGDGKELFYRVGDRMYAVTMQTSPSLSAGKPTVLFEKQFDRAGMIGGFDVTPDGMRFLVLRPVQPEPRDLKVVVGWSEVLKAAKMSK